MNKIELLAPAGDLEKLKIAIIYGADAVYFGGEMFSLRAGAGNLTVEEMEEGVAFAHERGKKCYLTINIFAHNEDVEPLREYLEKIKYIGIDAFLVSDPGVLDMIMEIIPEAEIHLSTQANMTNYRTALFWRKMGVRRLVLSRELTFPEIREIKENIPADMRNDFDVDDMGTYFENANTKGQTDYCEQLFKELCQHKSELDEKIGQYSQGWKIDRMPKTDIATLRLALCETRYIDDVPEAVAINEAVELAKKYGTEQSPKFVNAILGSISRE